MERHVTQTGSKNSGRFGVGRHAAEGAKRIAGIPPVPPPPSSRGGASADMHPPVPVPSSAKQPASRPVPPSSAGARRHYRGLDGIKGLAMVGILLFHMLPQYLGGGFVGVDVFFVATGFLITVSLLRQLERDCRIRLGRYYARRLSRLLPALAFMAPAAVGLGWLVDTDTLVGIGRHLAAALTFSYNWYDIAIGANYFAATSPQLFRHLWYVAVTAQFYLVAPLIVWTLRNAFGRRVNAALLTLLAIVPAAAMWLLFVPGADPTRVYFGTDTHCFGLLLGMALAFWMQDDAPRPAPTPAGRARLARRLRRAIAPWLAFIAMIALVVLSLRIRQDATAFRGGLAVAAVCAVLLIGGTICEGSWMVDLFEWMPLRALGTYSYGIYLWHWPIFVLVQAKVPAWRGPNAWIAAAVTMALTAFMTFLSWRYVEQPFARGGITAMLPFGGGHGIAGVVRAVAVMLVAILAVSGCVAGVVHAPAKSRTQIQLEQQQTRSNAQDSPDDVRRGPVPAPMKPKRVMPTGAQMSAIGDSVMLASSSALMAQFPGIAVDAQVSRAFIGAMPDIAAQAAAGQLRQYVVLGLNTNGEVTTDQLESALATIGPDRVMVLVLAHGDRTWIPVANQTCRDFAAAHDGQVVIADFDAAITPHPDFLGPDGIHPEPDSPGAVLYATTVNDAIAQWIQQGH